MIRRVAFAALVVAAGALSVHAATYVRVETATLRALDKITGRSTDLQIETGEPILYGALKIEMKACYQTPPEEAPESAAYLVIRSTQPVATETMDEAVAAPAGDEAEPVVFSGWMFASSPGLSALEHPVYDVWVVQCADTVEAPDSFFEDDEPDEAEMQRDEAGRSESPEDGEDIFDLR